MTELQVLVPRPGSQAALRIDSGSGIVTADLAPARVLVYYEGNRFGAGNMRAFGERVLHAAGRLDKHYPTIAMGRFDRDDFVVVGTFTFSADWRDFYLTITDAATLAQWAPDTKPPEEGA